MAKESKQFYAGLLRNGTAVMYRVLDLEERLGQYLYLGRAENSEEPVFDMWKNTGGWAESGDTHDLDLVRELGPIFYVPQMQ